jgi:hypothetical protein
MISHASMLIVLLLHGLRCLHLEELRYQRIANKLNTCEAVFDPILLEVPELVLAEAQRIRHMHSVWL